MNRNTKKGFTIVELIIVIAVIAVLAAVLIPTFSNLINQAQQAKDTALVSDLNKGLKMSGKEFDTMHDALTAVEENVGINVAKINAVATDSEILWDSVNQCFVYLKGGETEPTYIPDSKSKDVNGQYDYWQIVKAPTTTNVYSQYISGTDYTADVTVSTGLDVGDNTGIKNVTYSHTGTAQSVVVRTDGGKLTVNAAADTLKRFGTADSVQITAIAPQSYHEYGTVIGNIELASGRVVMESGSTAAAISIIAAANDITSGTATIAVDSKTSNVSVVVPADVKTAIEDSKDSKNTLPTTNVISDSTVIDNMSKFAGGIGTEASPYLIESIEHLKLVGNNDGKYYKLIADIDIDSSDLVTAKLFGSYEVKTVIPRLNRTTVLDGNGHTIQLPQVRYGQYEWVAELVTNMYGTIKNVTISFDNDGVVAGCTYNGRFENVTVEGFYEVTGNNAAFATYGQGGTFINCVNNVYLQGGGTAQDYNAIFVGWNAGHGYTYTFQNCINKGTLITGKAAMYVANTAQNRMTLVATGCKNEGTIVSTYMNESFKPDYLIASYSPSVVTMNLDNESKNLVNTKNGPSDATMSITINDDKTFNITKSEYKVKYYIVTITIYTSLTNGDGTNRLKVTERIESTQAETYTSNLKFLRFAEKTDEYTDGEKILGYNTIVKNGEVFYLVDVEGETLNGNIVESSSFSVSAYDENNRIISSVSGTK